MQTFPTLPVLEELKKLYVRKNGNLSNVYVVSVQHLLETTGSLFESIINIGINPQNIYLCGKIYSTHEDTLRKIKSLGIHVLKSRNPDKFGVIRETLKKDVGDLWEMIKPKLKLNDSVIILDDGGLAIKKIPEELLGVCRFYGIEQTTFGLRYQNDSITHLPIIQVATSAVKKYLEPSLISMALLNKLRDYFEKIKPRKIGVIGFGNIGKAVAYQFQENYEVFVFDKNPDALIDHSEFVKICENIEDLILKCDVIIGATGVDVSRNSRWEKVITEDKTFISVSSGDIEFNTLLKRYNDKIQNHKSVLDPVEVILDNRSKIIFYRGGTVANFDCTKESCPTEQIQITRGLLFAAVLQALDCNTESCDKKGAVKLNPRQQMIIIQKWFETLPEFKTLYSQTLLENFKSEKWIAENSGGNL